MADKKPNSSVAEAGVATRRFLADAVSKAAAVVAPLAAGGPVLAPVAAPFFTPGARAIARDFTRGLVTGDAAPPQPAAAAVKPTPQQAVTQALDKGAKTPPSEITPQDRAMAVIDTVLSKPFTLGQFNAAMGALPNAAAASGRQTDKDRLYGQYGAITDAIFQAQLSQAGQLAGAERDKATLEAFEARRKALMEGLGIDPSKAALAALYAQQPQDGG